jgi:XRE family transcriptional regulator
MNGKFDDFLQEQLQDLEILKEYEALQLDHSVIQARIDDEQKSEMLPKELDSLERISE